ncbi:hypothetical protein LIPSTDRAFT_69598 [Lipomyces starkeyi NRRL Y-11557]|uniref:Uncharacterized protein n=1 Tax=Lipomyces starkeyi NRRL Y-11557 TaxID=675824 RepID=A0A1E3Q735_LIPST|nr:hypothetical protein LIPSTDRAFT_70404 [Lipomyces starkeyi NRRL Y-11557]ODQ74057.1 hypothetical protein LIPSTDRAFT_69598 [Lipomyces starkeyi NRRL Y-11557]
MRKCCFVAERQQAQGRKSFKRNTTPTASQFDTVAKSEHLPFVGRGFYARQSHLYPNWIDR